MNDFNVLCLKLRQSQSPQGNWRKTPLGACEVHEKLQRKGRALSHAVREDNARIEARTRVADHSLSVGVRELTQSHNHGTETCDVTRTNARRNI